MICLQTLVDVAVVSSSILAVPRERQIIGKLYSFKTHSFANKSLLLPIVLTSDHMDNFRFVVLPSSEKKFTTFSEARRAKFPPWPIFFFFFNCNNLSFLQLSDFQNKSESNVYKIKRLCT